MHDALAALPGVRHVTIDFAKKQAVVSVEPSTADGQAFVRALEEAGYGGSVLNETPPAEQKSGTPPKAGSKKGAPNQPPSKNPGGQTASGAFGIHVSARAQLDHDAFHPGDPFRVAVVVKIGEGWHIYGNPVGPGIGKPTVLSAEAPATIQLDPARYTPAHKADQDFGKAGKTWVWEYTRETVLHLSGRVAKTAPPGTVELPIILTGQVCSATSCIPGHLTIPVTIRIVPKESSSKPVHADLFTGFDKAQPAGK